MSLAAFLLAPLAMLLPSPGAAVGAADGKVAGQRDLLEIPTHAASVDATGGGGTRRAAPSSTQPDPAGTTSWPYRLLLHGFDGGTANQVRIEQRMTIRIAPRAAAEPNMLADIPTREVGPKFIERKVGKCLPVARIAGVQASGPSKLILYLRDQRIVSAELERACRSRDFYSGFYLSRSDDGMLCVDRDTLLSRSGANCKLTRFRQLIEAE